MVSPSTPRADPAPLFDQVTGFPPDDAIDVTVPLPLSLAVHMTMLESRGRAAELAVLRRIHIEQARATARSIQDGYLDEIGAAAAARLRITHIVEQRVPGTNGLRPHVHAFVAVAVRDPGGSSTPVDVERLAALAESVVFPGHRDRLAAASAERVGLEWGETSWSACEVRGPGWLVERLSQLGPDDLACPGPWPRRQIVAGYGSLRAG